MLMPSLSTDRLVIRPFTSEDLDPIHRILDVELADADVGSEGAMPREARARWLAWTALGYEELAHLRQPPYGDRAVTLRDTGEVIGAVGYVPSLAPFGQIPSLGRGGRGGSAAQLNTPEVGLYYAISPAHQRRGHAAEAARALVDHAFHALRLSRVVATTQRDNAASIAVMRRLGMRVEENPRPEPPWLQVVGVLESPLAGAR